MRRFFCTIETIPSVVPPEGVKLKRNETPEEQHRKTALDSDYGRILTIGLNIVEENGLQNLRVLAYDWKKAEFNDNEGQSLLQFWYLLAANNFDISEDLLIGHNILGFHLPFIIKRSIVNHIRPTIKFNMAKYRSFPIYDTMHEWNCWSGQMIGLNELATILDLKEDDPLVGYKLKSEEIPDAYAQGKHKDIMNHCRDRLYLIQRVYNRINFL